MAKAEMKLVGEEDFRHNLNQLIAACTGSDLNHALMRGGFVVERAAKENIRKRGLILFGFLRTSVRTILFKPGIVLVGTHVIYAAIHEFGGTITAKNKPFLVFKVDDQWVRVKSVTIPARPYLRPALDKNRRKVYSEVKKTLQGSIHRRAAGFRGI